MKELAVDEWNLGELKGISADDFWTWAKTGTAGYDGHAYLGMDKWFNFEKDICFELGKWMCRKHWSVYQDHLEYICNGSVKPFRVGILCYFNWVREMHDLAKYLSPPSMRGVSYDADNWKVRDQGLTVSEIRVAIKDGLPLSMQDELNNHQ